METQSLHGSALRRRFSVAGKKPSTKGISVVTWSEQSASVQKAQTVTSQILLPNKRFWWNQLWTASLQERKRRMGCPSHQSGYQSLHLYVCHLEKERKQEKKGVETCYYFPFSCRHLEIIVHISLLQLAPTNGTVMMYSHETRNYFNKSAGR